MWQKGQTYLRGYQIMLTEKEMADWFDTLPDDKRDGMNKAQFINECKRVMDPKTNGRILSKMVEFRKKEATARHNKRVADRALERGRIGLR
jgi:hypothetical protein